MKKSVFVLLGALVLGGCGGKTESTPASLKDAIGDNFLIGTSINEYQIAGRDTMAIKVLKQHFNAIVAENCMKNGPIHPEENRYDFEKADQFVQFGVDNGLKMTGHCLIWHSQLAPWFCVDSIDTKASPWAPIDPSRLVSPEVLKQRMKDHITTVVQRYKGKLIGWDVVNEAIEDDGSWRKSPLFQILGEEFIPLAFQYAYEADPNIELYYNDYNMFMEGKRNAVVKLIKTLKDRGIRIDAVGMQGHIGMDYPTLEEFEASILAFKEAGVKVMITEFDMSALPTLKQTANVGDMINFRELREKGIPDSLNPYKNGLPEEVSKEWNNRMSDFFKLFIKHSDVITRVTAWGINDACSWKNGFPLPGRTDYPLFFDREYQPKPFIKDMMSQKKN